MKTSLVVLAAGMGSRFGGLKQLQPLTADGKVLLDFSIDDALSIGFDEIVFVIRKEMEEGHRITDDPRFADGFCDRTRSWIGVVCQGGERLLSVYSKMERLCF